MPSRSSAISSASPSAPAKCRLLVLGTRAAPPPFTAHVGDALQHLLLEVVAQRGQARAGGVQLRAGAAPAPAPALRRTGRSACRRAARPPDGRAPAPARPRRARTTSAPTPAGPPNLCAESESRSASTSRSETGTLPTACTASVWKSDAALAARRAPPPPPAAARPSRCWPTSASTAPRPASSAASIASARTRPSGVGRHPHHLARRAPPAASARPAPPGARCVEVTTAPRGAVRRARAKAPLSASASASEPEPVKHDLLRLAARAPAPPAARAASSRARASRPARCTLEGLPEPRCVNALAQQLAPPRAAAARRRCSPSRSRRPASASSATGRSSRDAEAPPGTASPARA